LIYDRSLPQMPQALTLMITSLSPARGGSTGSRRTSLTPWMLSTCPIQNSPADSSESSFSPLAGRRCPEGVDEGPLFGAPAPAARRAPPPPPPPARGERGPYSDSYSITMQPPSITSVSPVWNADASLAR